MIAMYLDKKKIRKFQKEILEWYEKNKRPLPWRQTRDPYAILVSEVMSQQTQISRVVPKYLEWMKRFPTLQGLADSSTKDVLRYWSGLGYNRRALYLQATARELVKNHNSKFPQTEEKLRQLPGIGEYTARAILCFAFKQQIAVVDTNVKKVILTRIMQYESRIKDQEIKLIADKLLPNGNAYTWNQALMDYAAAMLKQEKIPVPKQSHFKTSNRFYRGQIIRLLLKKSTTVDTLFETIENNGIRREEFEEIVKTMEKDRLILRKGNRVRIID